MGKHLLAFGKDDCFYLLCCCYYSNTLYKSIIVDSYRVVLDPLQLAHTHIHKLLNINHFLFCHKHLSLKPIPTNDTTSITNLSLVNLYSTFNVQTWYTCPFSTRWTITFPRTKTSPTNQFISTNPHHVTPYVLQIPQTVCHKQGCWICPVHAFNLYQPQFPNFTPPQFKHPFCHTTPQTKP